MKIKPTFVSHLYRQPDDSGKEEWTFQSNEEHSAGVARLAEQFAGEFGMPTWGRVLGLLHDKGKERTDFQRYILKASGYDESIRGIGEHSHAYVGGLIARELYGAGAGSCLVNPIAAHHRGLYDYDELQNLLREKAFPPEIKKDCERLLLERPPFPSFQSKDAHHLCRMLYSCLVDADYLDTERFMDSEAAALRGGKRTLAELLPLLDGFLAHLRDEAKDTEVNRIRGKVQQRCLETSAMPLGFYSLTVPTGGGKTLSSLVWAMHHAIAHGKHRIIIAIPYTSIIVQTAAILKGIFGEENVLEHHSNVEDSEDKEGEEMTQRLRLATENWDYPIIVTTNVRLFESMLSNKPSACRKLHHIVNSVVILDEVQTLPTDHLLPIVDTLKTYNSLFGVSVLFTTASQPVLSGVVEGCNPNAGFSGIDHITEIIPNDYRLHDKLRRVELSIDDTPRTYDEMAAALCRHKRVLCVVNTRRDAKEIFQRLPGEGITLHLSRMMCPDHVAATIGEIKEALKDDGNDIIRVVATQLVEAGVDIDFPVVYRQEAGLDSVLQAAGRCNREGRLSMSTTCVFSLALEHPLPYGAINDGNNARKNLTDVDDWFAPETMSRYFEQLYCRCKTFDAAKMEELLYNPAEICFEEAARNFRLIDDAGTSVIVCWKDSADLVERLRAEGPTYPLMKKLARYSVSLHHNDLEKLREIGVVEEIVGNVCFVINQAQYNEHLGLLIDNQWENETIIK